MAIEYETAYSDFEDELISYSALITNLLSISGSLFILIVFWTIKETRNFSNKLVMYLAIADLVNAFGSILITKRNDHVMTDSGLCK